MKKKIIILFILLTYYSISLAFDFGHEKIIEPLKPGTKAGVDMVDIIENIVAYLVGFLYLVAIILGLYAGFTILTSGGEEEKVKKGKNILVFVLIGIVVVFFSSVIINWVITSIKSDKILGT